MRTVAELMTTDESGIGPKHRAFLDALPEYGSITAAAHAVGVERTTVYGWIERVPGFADALQHAKESAADNLEAALYRQASHPETSKMGTIAAFFLLKGWRPQVYADNVNIKHSGSVTNVNVDLNSMSAEDRTALFQLALDTERTKLLPAPETPPQQ